MRHKRLHTVSQPCFILKEKIISTATFTSTRYLPPCHNPVASSSFPRSNPPNLCHSKCLPICFYSQHRASLALMYRWDKPVTPSVLVISLDTYTRLRNVPRLSCYQVAVVLYGPPASRNHESSPRRGQPCLADRRRDAGCHTGTAACTPSTNLTSVSLMLSDYAHWERIVRVGLCSSHHTLDAYAGGPGSL